MLHSYSLCDRGKPNKLQILHYLDEFMQIPYYMVCESGMAHKSPSLIL